MNQFNLNRFVVLRIILLAASSVVLALVLVEYQNLPAAIVFFVAIIIQTIFLIRHINILNRKVAFFFDAVENDDSSLYYPEKVKDKSLKQLNESLNRVNSKIQASKKENKEKEQYYAALLEQVSTGICVLDETGFVYQANSAAKLLLHLEQFTHLVQLKRVDEKLYNIFYYLQSGEKRLIRFSVNKKKIELSLQATIFKTASRSLKLFSLQDIHSELDEKESDAWIRLIRVLTHEIMNSIAPITSLSETLMRFLTQNGQAKHPDNLQIDDVQNTIDGLEVIGERGVGLIAFVDSYRKLTRIPQPKKEKIPVESMIDKIRILVSTEKGFEQTRFKVSVEPSNLKILADENQIRHVLINLVKNALEALNGKEDGVIEIRSKVESNGKASISITDNGPGIPQKLIDQVFVPFFTTKEKGSGIGLSFSRQVLRLHGGSLQVNSEEETGTTLKLTF